MGRRGVSVPWRELVEAQDEDDGGRVLGGGKRGGVAVEAGMRHGWDRWLMGDGGKAEKAGFVGMSGFGASAPAEVLFEKFGITAEAVVQKVKDLL